MHFLKIVPVLQYNWQGFFAFFYFKLEFFLMLKFYLFFDNVNSNLIQTKVIDYLKNIKILDLCHYFNLEHVKRLK